MKNLTAELKLTELNEELKPLSFVSHRACSYSATLQGQSSNFRLKSQKKKKPLYKKKEYFEK